MRRRSLYKYFSERKWAEAFINGEVLFRSLSYFRDYEDNNVREDQNEGTSIFRPEGGLIINNLTQGTTFTLQEHAFALPALLFPVILWLPLVPLAPLHGRDPQQVGCVGDR